MKTAFLILAALFVLPAAQAQTSFKVDTVSWGVNAYLACQQAVSSSTSAGETKCHEQGLAAIGAHVNGTMMLSLFHCSASVTVFCAN